MYRVAQEALQNIVKHADAETAEIWLRVAHGRALLKISDDGHGIDPDAVSAGERSGRYGLSGVAERAQLLGGRLELMSTRGNGTTLRLSVPVTQA